MYVYGIQVRVSEHGSKQSAFVMRVLSEILSCLLVVVLQKANDNINGVVMSFHPYIPFCEKIQCCIKEYILHVEHLPKRLDKKSWKAVSVLSFQ